MKVENKTRTIVIITLAVAQCYLATGCARTAMLDSAKKAAVLKAAADKEKAKQPGLPDLPATNPGATPTPSASANPGSASAPASDATLNASLGTVELDVDAKTGTARLSFSYSTDSQSSSIGPMIAHLDAATAPSGADMEAPPGVLGYVAHLQCKAADCASATLSLSKLKAPLAGKALIHIDRFPLTRQKIKATGTPKGFEANVVSAFQSQGKIDIAATIVKIDGGSSFFKVDNHFPSGAIVPGQPTPDNGRRIVVRGTLGDNAPVSVSYVDTDTDVAAGTRKDYKGKASYSEKDKAIHVELGADGADGISGLDFDAPSI